MNPKDLLAAFDTLAEAPGSASLLRDLVLSLAVRGKLATGHPEDEPAKHLLARIAEAKKRLTKAKVISKPRALPSASLLPDVSELPDRWQWAYLADCVAHDLTDGDWVESKDQDPEGEVRLTQLADVGVNAFKDVSQRYLTSETADRLNCTPLIPGDVMIARLPRPLGRACIFPGSDQTCVTVVDVAIARIEEGGLYNRYLVHAINSPDFRDLVEAHAAGSTRKRVSTGNLRKLPVPVPPLAEQHRIVACVDELMALLDRLEAAKEARDATRAQFRDAALAALQDANDAEEVKTAWSRIADHMHDLFTDPADIAPLRQLVFHLAVHGHVVAQDPDDEPSSALVEHVAAEKARLLESKTIRKVRAVKPVDHHTPDTLPSGWTFVMVDDIADPRRPISYGVLKPGPDDPDGIQLVKSQHVLGRTVQTDGLTRISRSLDAQYQRTKLNGGEVLVNVVGSIGRCAVVPTSLAGANVSRAVAVVPVSEAIDAQFLVAMLESFFTERRIKDVSTGSAQPVLNLSVLRGITFGLPPLPEQRHIVEKVDELMALLDCLETTLRSSREIQEAFCASAVRSMPGDAVEKASAVSVG